MIGPGQSAAARKPWQYASLARWGMRSMVGSGISLMRSLLLRVMMRGAPRCYGRDENRQFTLSVGMRVRYWQLRASEDGTARLWPPEFYQEFVADDFSNGNTDAVEAVSHIARLTAGTAT